MNNQHIADFLKRLRTVLLTAVLTSGMLIPSVTAAAEKTSADTGSSQNSVAAEVPFADVTDADWFFQAVHDVWSKGIMNGVSNTRFSPEDPVTRGMAVTVLYRMADQPADCLVNYFSDVDYHEYYASAVGWAYEKKVINGFGDGTFRPEEAVTREQMAAILSRDLQQILAQQGIAIEVYIDPEAHPDWNQVSSWAVDATAWLVGTGLMKGSGTEQLLLPEKTMTRAELAQLLQRSADFLTDQLDNHQSEQGFPLKAESTVRSFADSIMEQMPAEQNWAISPYSLKLCLAMLANGTDGSTREELLRALKIDDLDHYNQEVRALLERYDSYQKIMNLETADSLWINQDRFNGKGQFLPDFTDLLKTCYRAETREVRDANSVEEMNRWADEKTHGKISQIANEGQRYLPTALMNAVYFKAAWSNPFHSGLTKPQAFHSLDGTESEMPFMHQTGHMDYFEADGIRAVRLPYKKYTADDSSGTGLQYFSDADFSMYILMSDGQPDLQYVLDHADFESKEVKLAIPKFKMEYGITFNDKLKILGVKEAFDPVQADLSRMMDPSLLRLYLDSVMQKAWIAIDEEGTEAAAVTILWTGAGRPPEVRRIIEFTADRPFYFVIRDDSNGSILFAGKYNQAE